MKNYSSFIGFSPFVLITALVVSVAAAGAGTALRGLVDTTTQDENDHPILAPCSRYEDRYTDKAQFDGKYLKEWEDLYHDTVNDVIEEHLETPELSCDALDYATLSKPGPKLQALAQSLPTWKDPEVRLAQYDLSRVLLEYLRVYECALNEFENGPSEYETASELSREEDEGVRPQDPIGNIRNFFLNIFWRDLLQEDATRKEMIKREKVAAREALTRTLGIISALDRLRPLELELQCMQRISLDVRNITALSAEASACLPRVWNGKDILRDLK